MRARMTASLVLAAGLLLLPAIAWGQQASGIAGVVRDTSGAVLPGVTVEAASPVLIEKVRVVISDSLGVYRVVDLQPGTYTVTFTLPGFSTFRREGIELTSGFTATVNAEMRVGALEETVTVSGAAPLVDTQNVRKQLVVSRQMLDALPTGLQGVQNLGTLTPGISGYGFLTGEYQINIGSYHGQSEGQAKYQFNGMGINTSGGGIGYTPNPDTVEEMTLQTNGIGAESNASGVLSNVIPKEGGNAFKGSFSGMYNNEQMQGDNLTDELRARGVSSVNVIQYMYAGGGTLGGPIKKDKLWFFTAQRWWGHSNLTADVYWNKTQGTPLYTPDLSRRANRYELFRSHAGRVTWQASKTSKFNFFADVQDWCLCRRSSLVQAPEAGGSWHFSPHGLYQVTWSAPMTNRLLLEAGAHVTLVHYPATYQPGVTPSHISTTELSTNFRYNASTDYNDPRWLDRYAQRFAVSYVTGSHSFKVGLDNEPVWTRDGRKTNGNVWYNFLRGAPVSLVQLARPHLFEAILPWDLGIYAQDQWTVRRLTLNLGLRFEYRYGYVPAQTVPATPNGWVPERRFDAVKGVPSWTDVRPRMGVAYDLFGNGRTALKVSLGQYSGRTGIQMASDSNPINTSVNSVSRTWNDVNGNYVPDCDLGNRAANGECGAMSDPNFGGLKITTRFADDVRRGFGIGDYNWDLTTELHHQFNPSVSVTAGYYRNWYGNFSVTDNLAVTPADFDPFCVTAPNDSRLPGGGGYQACGFYDISLAKFGQVDNLVAKASNYGKQTKASDFFGGSFDTRFGSGFRLGGGVDLGRTVTDNCFVVDSPQQLVNCHQVVPFKGTAQVKLNGSYPLPGDFVVSGVFLNVAGPQYTADYPAANAEIAPSLGRNLAACGTRVPCTATSATGGGGGATIGGGVAGALPLYEPFTQFEGRRTQLDLRLTKFLNIGRKMRLQANVDVYNILNTSPIVNVITTYGPNWRKPITVREGPGVQDARLLQVSGKLTF